MLTDQWLLYDHTGNASFYIDITQLRLLCSVLSVQKDNASISTCYVDIVLRLKSTKVCQNMCHLSALIANDVI